MATVELVSTQVTRLQRNWKEFYWVLLGFTGFYWVYFYRVMRVSWGSIQIRTRWRPHFFLAFIYLFFFTFFSFSFFYPSPYSIFSFVFFWKFIFQSSLPKRGRRIDYFNVAVTSERGKELYFLKKKAKEKQRKTQMKKKKETKKIPTKRNRSVEIFQ